MDRREFLVKVFIGGPALLGGAQLLSACGRDDASDIASYLGMSCSTRSTGVTASIGAPIHGNAHSLTLALADIDAGVAKSYSIKGASGHDHSISLSAENFAALRSGQSVSTVSTTGASHTHTVTLTCIG